VETDYQRPIAQLINLASREQPYPDADDRQPHAQAEKDRVPGHWLIFARRARERAKLGAMTAQSG
jgi:hypothetical protein